MNLVSNSGQGASSADRADILRAALSTSGLGLGELWAGCVSLGDIGSHSDLAAILAGVRAFDDHQHNVIAQALNDRFIDLEMGHPVPYAYQT